MQPVGSLTLKMTRVLGFSFFNESSNDNADLLRFAPCELLGGYAQMRVDLNLMRGLSLAERIKDESKI